MMVEHKMGSGGGGASDDGVEDFFPEGLKVLAVDDNPTCLKILENSLKKLQYQVTTTNRATKALEMLRENKNRFDLVISDVEMPDMDGLKLLELVGLEMDLPVIMLSAHGDYKLVKEGIKHGACDYMLKPVSWQQLKNIWQHVFRRKRLDPKKKPENLERGLNANGRGAMAASSTANADTDAKHNRKRKDQNEEDEEDSEDNGHDDDSSSQKKPRVVWSVDLHKKFVWAVNQLGYEKAVPKKILDLMNVEGLTRENVASHLQKFRLYLKKTSQQCNLGAGYGGKDSPYMRVDSLSGYGDFRAFGGSGRLSTVSLSAYPPGGMLRRLNTPTGLSLRGITTSSTLVQPTISHNSSNTISTLGKLQSGSLPSTRNTSLFQGMPAALELKNIQQNNNIIDIASFRTDPGFTNPTERSVCLNNSMPNLSSNQLVLQGTSKLTKVAEEPGTQASHETESLPSRLLDSGTTDPIFVGENRCNESWPTSVSLSNFSSANPLQPCEAFNHQKQHPIDSREGFSSSNPLLQKSSSDFSSTGLFSSDLAIYGGDMEGQGGLLGNVVQDLSFPSSNRWGDNGQDYQSKFGTFNSAASATVPLDSLNQNTDQRNPFGNKASNSVPFSCPSTTGTPPFQQRELDISSTQMNTSSSLNCYAEQAKLLDASFQSQYEPFDDLVNSMIKQEPNGSMTMDGEFFI